MSARAVRRPTVPAATASNARGRSLGALRTAAIDRQQPDRQRDPTSRPWPENWLFADSETACRRPATIMSLLARAKANAHELLAWLDDVPERLPTTKDSSIETLLPHRWQRAGK